MWEGGRKGGGLAHSSFSPSANTPDKWEEGAGATERSAKM